ncbi:hypothetical protein [Phenylobacterium sp.]|jgi:hypothetical protein|uniref:hypothetical protein n=1 Tax=Phenylobacterium sp. TaxID=1871053 RepID=UPI00378508A6
MSDDPVNRPPGGDGEARGTGYGAGGLGSGQDRAAGKRPQAWDAPGVTPGGERTGSSTDGPRIPQDGEADPD